MALALIAKSLLALRLASGAPFKPGDTDEDERASLPRALTFAGLGVGYMVIAPWVGFAVAIALLVMATALFEGARLSWRLGAVAAAVGLGFWLVFVRFLGVEQPISRLIG